MKMRGMLLGTAAALWMTSMARASVDYSYVAQFQSSTPALTYGVNLYLQEVSTPGSFTAASEGGLYAGGVALVEQPGSTGITISSGGVSNNAMPEPNGFTGNDNHGLFTSGGAWITDITNNNDTTAGVVPVSTTTSNGTTTSLYLLGSVTISQTADGYGTFLVESLHDAPMNDGAPAAGTDGNTLTFQVGNDLDAGGFSPGVVGADGHPTLFYSADFPVPEPTTTVIFGVLATGLIARRRAARRRSA